jgi:hypothetical protein
MQRSLASEPLRLGDASRKRRHLAGADCERLRDASLLVEQVRNRRAEAGE